MSEGKPEPEGLDFSLGVEIADVAEGEILQGHVRGESALLIRRGDEFFFIGDTCTHYHGPLAAGLVVADTIRCPWHHACFSLRSGEALRAPALDPVSCWRAERKGTLVIATEKLEPIAGAKIAPPPTLGKVVIVGGGAAGLAAAQTLRKEGYGGAIALVSADEAAPYDRPNLSKDYLAGSAPEDWLPLRAGRFYEDNRIELELRSRAESIDVEGRSLRLDNGARLGFDALLLATGAEPVRLTVPGADHPRVRYLRSLADSRAIIAAAAAASRVVVVGASFIGLEVAASMRARGLEVHVVAPDAVPMQKTLGEEFGRFIRATHEAHGVVFHLGETVASIDDQQVVLSGGGKISAELVVVGIGVRPALALAEGAGLAIDRGVLVDEYLETSAPGIFAAGDIARWPDRTTGERIRIEHWVTAQRQGQTAARNILGRRERFEAAPFFWSQHYDVIVNYVGHAPSWDRIEISGDIEAMDCAVSYFRRDRKLAVATIFRDLENLRAEVGFEEATGA
ncbi:MAG: pyridine nucleotide-disulfide oxidoreductase [Methylocystaceae bacterium]|nr:MAG: pyridine nucleotide-disulfide oxidoreductase [Methylocystaceae bacterium]